jgi:hypothetical protein
MGDRNMRDIEPNGSKHLLNLTRCLIFREYHCIHPCICRSLYDYSVSLRTVQNGRLIREQWVGKERSCIIELISWHFAGGSEKNHEKSQRSQFPEYKCRTLLLHQPARFHLYSTAQFPRISTSYISQRSVSHPHVMILSLCFGDGTAPDSVVCWGTMPQAGGRGFDSRWGHWIFQLT